LVSCTLSDNVLCVTGSRIGREKQQQGGELAFILVQIIVVLVNNCRTYAKIVSILSLLLLLSRIVSRIVHIIIIIIIIIIVFFCV